jgi:hypothetical protein
MQANGTKYPSTYGGLVALIKGGLIARRMPLRQGKPLDQNGGRHHVQVGRARQRHGPCEYASINHSDAPVAPTPGLDDYGRGLLPQSLHEGSVAERQLFYSRPKNIGVQAAWCEHAIHLQPSEPGDGNENRLKLKRGLRRALPAQRSKPVRIRPCTPLDISSFREVVGGPGALPDQGIGGDRCAGDTGPSEAMERTRGWPRIGYQTECRQGAKPVWGFHSRSRRPNLWGASAQTRPGGISNWCRPGR